MIVSASAIPTTPCAMPDMGELSPKRKNRAYILQAGRGYLTLYNNSGSTDFYRNGGRYEVAEDYANGDNKVRSVLKQERDGLETLGQHKVDFRPLPLLHKPLMSVEGLLKDHSYEATVTPVDPVSLDERASYEGKMRAWMQHQEFLQSMGLDQPGGAGADIPVDEDDLALHMDVSYKIREAIDLEQKIAYGMYLADYARQDQQCTRDETVKGVSVLYMARRGPRRLPMRLDPADCFILPARSEDFPNLQAGAHIERLSLGQVLSEIHNDPDTTLSENDRQQLENIAQARQSGTFSSNNYWLDPVLGGKPELAGQIEVVRFAFLSTDLEVQKEYTNKFGNKQIRVMEASYGGPQEDNKGQAKDMQVHRRAVQNWYEGTLVLGTDIGYGCRKCYEQLRDEDNAFNCLPLYIVNAPGMMGKKIKSMVERCMIAVDIASRAVVKMQHTEAKWPDIIMKMNSRALEEAKEGGGTGGTVITRKEILRFAIAEGMHVGDDVDADGNPIGAAIEFIESPLGNSMNRHWLTIQNSKNEIADITGINGAVSGDDPASRQGEGVTQLAISGSQNALNHLYVAKRSRFERVAKAIAASIKAGEDKGRAPLTGPMQVKTGRGPKAVYVKPNPDIAKRQYQFKIEQKPTQELWQRFYQSVDGALKQEQITAGDVAFLYTVDNLKQARYLLDVRTKRNQKLAAEQAEANSKMQAEQATAAAQAKGEEDRKTDDYKTDNKIRLKKIELEGQERIAKIQAGQHLEATAMNQDAKLQTTAMQHEHAAGEAAAGREQDLMKHDAELTSAEDQAALERQHQMELAAAQPEPVGA